MKNSPNRNQLWAQGIIAAWYLRDSQLDIYYLLQKEKFAFIEAARRFGKTTSILCFVLEKLIQNPHWICRWCFPFKNQAREVLVSEITKIQQYAPEHLRFEYKMTDSYYQHPNGSRLYLRGVNEDRGESARGPAANIIIADEYGFWVESDYIIREVLSPQLQNQEGRHLIKASTPPRNLGHPYYTEREVAFKKQRFIQKTIMQNEALTKEELEEIIEECGGVNSPSFRRERMCEPVSDPEMLIIPEWNDEINIIPDDYPRPAFFTPYVAGDSGLDDNTAVVFGYYDFLKNERVIEREYVNSKQTTKNIILECKKIESELWGDLKPNKRVYDADKQIIYDIFVDHKYPIIMPNKADKMAAIHDLRVEVGAGRLKVKSNCTNTIRQLKVGMWKDERHTDFERSEGLGHLDAIAATIYFNRCIDTKLNPYPTSYGFDYYTQHKQQSTTSLSETDQAFKNVFGPKRGFR